MNGNPKLAVVVTCFNYARFVSEAIESVKQQCHPDCELVVIDDGSTDGSWDVINSLNVAAVKTDNRGQLAACIHGLNLTTAPFVLFLDADDKLKPGSLTTILKNLDSSVAKLQFALTRVDGTGKIISSASPALEDYREKEKLRNRVLRTGVYLTPPTSGNVFRRDVCEVLKEIDYERSVDGVILYIAPFMGDIVSISEELGCYRLHDNNISSSGSKPNLSALQKDLSRFKLRMEHLRKLVLQKDQNSILFETADIFVVRERELYIRIASGLRPRLIDVFKLLNLLWKQEQLSMNRTILLSLFFCVSAFAPNPISIVLLENRFSATNRNILGALQSIRQLIRRQS